MSRLYGITFFFILSIGMTTLSASDNVLKTRVTKEDNKEQSEKVKIVNCNSIDSQMPLPPKKIQLIESISVKIATPPPPPPQQTTRYRQIIRENTVIESPRRLTSRKTQTTNSSTQSEPSAETRPASDSPSLFERIKRRLRSLSSYSKRMCAQGVRNILNDLFGKKVSSGPPAKYYDQKFLSQWRTENSCYKKSNDLGADFKNYDIRVLQPKNRREAGHIEIYIDGRWYSDFKQKISLWNSGNSKYSSKSLYRFSDCTTAMLFKSLQEFFNISSAYAADENATPDDKTPFPKHDEILAAKDQWLIKEFYADQGTDYKLLKIEKGIEVTIFTNSNSIYSLIDQIKDKSLAAELAKNAIDRWVTKEGRKSVQKTILNFEAFTKLQEQSYLKAGFSLPKKYTIY